MTETNQEIFGKRLAERRKKLGLTQKDLGAAVGVSVTSIQNYENGQIPRGEMLVTIGRTLGCTAEWLVTGDKQNAADNSIIWDGRERRDNHDRRRGQLQTFVCGDREMVMVPLLETVLSSGTGSLETGGAALGSYGFRYDYLKRKGNPQTMRLFLSTGDSNYPEILDKDLVLIDTSQTRPIPGKKFAISVHGMTYIKQIDADAEGLLLISRNPDYPPIRVDMRGDESGDVYIIGRMICLCRDFD